MRTFISKEIRAKVAQLHADGQMSARQCAANYGVSEASVYLWSKNLRDYRKAQTSEAQAALSKREASKAGEKKANDPVAKIAKIATSTVNAKLLQAECAGLRAENAALKQLITG